MSLLFSVVSKLNLKSVDDIQLSHETSYKSVLEIARRKPIKAARQCGQTEFPLSETIC